MEWLKTPWFQQVWTSTYPYLPRIGLALVILIGGWLLAYVIHKIIHGALKRTTLDDRIADWLGVETGGEHGDRIEAAISRTVYYILLAFVVVAFFSYLKIDAVTTPLVTVLNEFASAVPNLAKAVLIGLGGFALATIVRRIIVGGLEKLGFERHMQKLSGEAPKEEPVEKATDDRKRKKRKKPARPAQPVTATLGEVAYWFIIAVSAIPVLESLKIGALAEPLSRAFSAVTTYLPKIGAALILLVVGYLLARLVRRTVAGALARVGVDRAVSRLGFGKVTGQQTLSGILGSIAMAFVLLHFATSAVGRLEIAEISAPLTLMLDRIYVYLPKLLVGAVLMAIGVVVARIAGNVAARLVAAMGFNTLMAHIGVYKTVSEEARRQEAESKHLVEQRFAVEATASAVSEEEDEAAEDDLLASHGSGGIQTPSDVLGVVVGAIVVLLFVRQVLGTLGLSGLAVLLDGLLAFLPNVLVACVLVGAGLWAGAWSHKRVDELTRGSSDRLLRSLGSVAHVAVVAFTIMMALQQLGVGRQLIAIAFALVLGAVCLALALAFGLGGRDVAGRILQKEYNRHERR